jgi:hypothetical protein
MTGAGSYPRKPTRSSRRWIRTRGSTGLDPDPWVGSVYVYAGSAVGSGPAGPLASRLRRWLRIRGSAADRILSWIRARGSIGGSDPWLDPGRARLRPCLSNLGPQPQTPCRLPLQASKLHLGCGHVRCLNLASGLLCAVAVNCSDVMAFLDSNRIGIAALRARVGQYWSKACGTCMS